MMAYAVLAIVFYNNDGWFQFISLSMICDDINKYFNNNSATSQQQFFHNKKLYNLSDNVLKYLDFKVSKCF